MHRTYFLVLDLKNDEQLIAEYEAHHQKVWPEIEQSIIDSGIITCEIFRFSNRLMMKLEVNDDFDFSKKNEMDAGSSVVKEWEELMWKYQQSIPAAPFGSKWQLMTKIYELQA
jgi:L-rhamnose mutarotase